MDTAFTLVNAIQKHSRHDLGVTLSFPCTPRIAWHSNHLQPTNHCAIPATSQFEITPQRKGFVTYLLHQLRHHIQ